MPRNGSNVYSKPSGTTAVSGATIDSADYNSTIDDLVTDANTARALSVGGTGGATALAARDTFEVSAKALDKGSAYTAVAADRSKLIRGTASLTLTLTAAATLGDGWFIDVLSSTGTMTIDPDGAETIDGSATLAIPVSKSARIRCNGTAFYSQFSAAVATSVVDDTTPQLGGSLDTNSFAVDWSKGADVASATELLLLRDGNSVDVSGTTTIVTIEDTADAIGIGSHYTLHFDGILTLTHHATNLVLPSGANITTAAGDIAVMYKYAAADWRCVSYTKASGEAVVDASVNSVKAWVSFTGTGTPAIDASDNVTSITDNATGDYDVNFTVNIEDADYAVTASAIPTTANYIHARLASGGKAVGSINVITSAPNASGFNSDATSVHVVIHR